ncbi:protein kinase [Streptomyces sp. B6B3]|uniref:protein kinase n=1 Tax=Streptomyces sp. B6B3 TaxID=3153570 RepID=UPI00325E41FB
MDTYDRYDAYAGRLLADRYRLPRAPSEEFELVESRAYDTVVGQEVLVRQVPLPEVVDAEVLDGDGGEHPGRRGAPRDRAIRDPDDPTVRRALRAALAASRLPDHPRLDQVFDVFVQGDGLWIVSELVTARPLAAVLAEERLKPYRAAEVAADLLAALRIVHAHGWTHRNLTARTVLICEDGRAVLTGLAAGAAEEALCGYDPLPPDDTTRDAFGPPDEQQEKHAPGARDEASAPGVPPVAPPGRLREMLAADEERRGLPEASAQGYEAYEDLEGSGGYGDYGGYEGPGRYEGPSNGLDTAGGWHPGRQDPPDTGRGADWRRGPSGAGPAGGEPGDPNDPNETGGWRPREQGGAPDPNGAGGWRRGPSGAGATGGEPGDPNETGGWRPVGVSGERNGAGGWHPTGPHGQSGDRSSGGDRYGDPHSAGGWPPGDRPGGPPGAGGRRPGDPLGSAGSEHAPPAGQAWDGQEWNQDWGARDWGAQEWDGQAGPVDPAPGSGSYPPSVPGWGDRSGPGGPASGAEGWGGAPRPAEGPVDQEGRGPASPMPEAYRRWDTGAVPRVEESPQGGAAGLVARMRQQGGQPQPEEYPPGPEGPEGTPTAEGTPPAEGDRQPGGGFPASWDFEGGADQGGRAAIAAARAAEERAARSGAIAAYRAGTQAGANATRGGAQPEGAPPSGHTSPAELPGPRRVNQPVRPGWESTPRHVQPPQWRDEEQPPPAESGPAPVPDLPDRTDRTVHPVPRAAVDPLTDPLTGPLPAPLADSVEPPVPVTPGVRAERYRGPDSALAAERARQARMTTVGAVTERWAPEQAGPVYEHWRLAPPVGPAADFWALGALLFRAVQGYPAYPEESTAELVQAVCAEQPAFAEDCGALRPVVESLLRQDPTERPSAEELRGWLRSLLRSAPEPEVGRNTVTAPPPALEPGRPADPRRLPIVRRRGVMVGPLRRRPRLRAPRGPRGPRRLGRVLLTLILLGLAGAVAYVLAFAPGEDGSTDTGAGPTQDADPTTPPPEVEQESAGGTGAEPEPTGENEPTDEGGEGQSGGGSGGQPDDGPAVPDGYRSVDDPAGFALVVPEGFDRQGETGEGSVVYADGALEIVVVPGRDSTEEFGDDPMSYQLQQQPELAAYRADAYGTSSELYDIAVGDSTMVTGVFGWQEGGSASFACNQVIVLDGRFHVVMVQGPAGQEDRIREINDVTGDSYSVTD